MHQKLLVIDDQKPIHNLVKALLAEEPLEVHSALDAEYGLALAASLQPDMVLLDVDMPTMVGFEACRLLKSNPATANLPVVFFTASNSPDERVHGLQLGAADFIAKPCDHDELIARVRSVMGTSRTIQDLKQNALVDPLTGLGNKTMFERRMAAELSLRFRFRTPVSCIVLSIDNFDLINRSCDGAFGREALRKVAEVIESRCRIEDVACRYDEERFAVITPHIGLTEAAALAEQLKDAVSEIRLEEQWVPFDFQFNKESEPLELTCSVGVADAIDRNDRSLFQRADAAMFHSKQAGGNRVWTAAISEPRAAAA